MRYFTLSDVHSIRSILRSRWFPMGVQAALLLLFLGLVVVGWERFVPDGVDSKLFAKSNLMTLTIWGLWWPSMILAAVLLGRAWCAVCPLEMVSRFSEWLGRRVGVPQRLVSGWMRSGWLILFLYGIAQLLIAGVQMHRVPMYTSLYLLAMLGLAFLSGLFFLNRAYCRTLCPVGLLLKIYGRGGMLAMRSVEVDDHQEAAVMRSCRSKLQPMRLASSGGEDCMMCMDCVKAGGDSGHMQFRLRLPWSGDDRRPWLADWPVTLFVMMLSGFVAYEISGFWSALRAAFLWAPLLADKLLAPAVSFAWLKGIWTIAVFPLLLWSIMALPGRFLQRSGRVIDIWKRMAYPVSMILAALHMTKALEKLATWAGYLPYALREVSGEVTVRAIGNRGMAMPAPLAEMSTILAVGVMLLAASMYLIRREAGMNRKPVLPGHSPQDEIVEAESVVPSGTCR